MHEVVFSLLDGEGAVGVHGDDLDVFDLCAGVSEVVEFGGEVGVVG